MILEYSYPYPALLACIDWQATRIPLFKSMAPTMVFTLWCIAVESAKGYSNNVWGNCFRSLFRASVSDNQSLFYFIMLLCFILTMVTLVHCRRKSPSPSPPRRRKSRSPSERRYRKKRSRSVTSSPVAKSSPHLGPPENKNAIDKQKLEEEKKRWGVSALLFRI